MRLHHAWILTSEIGTEHSALLSVAMELAGERLRRNCGAGPPCDEDTGMNVWYQRAVAAHESTAGQGRTVAADCWGRGYRMTRSRWPVRRKMYDTNAPKREVYENFPGHFNQYVSRHAATR